MENSPKKSSLFHLTATAFTVCLLSTQANAQVLGDWDWSLELHGWLPDITGTAANGADIDVPLHDILENLDFTLQGKVTATRGDWSVFADGVYLSMGSSGSTSTSLPVGRFGQFDDSVDADIDLDSFISTFGGGYRFHQDKNTNLSFVGGIRYLYMKVKIDADVDADLEGEIDKTIERTIGRRTITKEIRREFSRELSETLNFDDSANNWDGIIGLQGETKINDDWTLLYYGDIGTGDSDFTWQARLGLRYAFEKFDVSLSYRYLDFQFDDNAAVDELTVSGPMFGIRWQF